MIYPLLASRSKIEITAYSSIILWKGSETVPSVAMLAAVDFNSLLRLFLVFASGSSEEQSELELELS